jgi:cystathionine beta-lyase
MTFDAGIARRGSGCNKWDRVDDGVIPLSIADMDFPTAPAVIDALRARLDHPVFGYGFGDRGVLDTVLAWYKRVYNVEVEREWLMLLPGVVPALGALTALAEGDVLAQTPNYSGLLNAPGRVGRTVARVPMHESVTDGVASYAADYDSLSRAAESSGLFYLCNPHNPVGIVYTRAELSRFADFARERELVVVSDEIHAEVIFEKPHVPFFSVDGGLENSITLTAPGKICNMPDITGAIAVVPDEKLRERVTAIYPRVGLGTLHLAAIGGAYSAECDEWKRELNVYLAQNRDYLQRELLRRFPRAAVTHTEGSYLQWVDFRAYNVGNAKEWLLEHAKIAVAGGVDFGGGEDYFRINFGCPKSTLTEALDRIERALSSRG